MTTFEVPEDEVERSAIDDMRIGTGVRRRGSLIAAILRSPYRTVIVRRI